MSRNNNEIDYLLENFRKLKQMAITESINLTDAEIMDTAAKLLLAHRLSGIDRTLDSLDNHLINIGTVLDR